MMDTQLAQQFLDLLHGKVHEGHVAFLYRPRGSAQPRQVFAKPQELPSVASRGTEAWVSVGSFTCRKRLAANAWCLPSLYADLDPPKEGQLDEWRQVTLQRLVDYIPTPSLIVDSGRGFHAYWLLATPVRFPEDLAAHQARRADLQQLNRALQQDLRGDAVADVARVLRLPGSINSRTGRPCTVIMDNGPHYELDTLEAMLGSRESVEVGLSAAIVRPKRRGRPMNASLDRCVRKLPRWAQKLVIGGAWAAGGRYVVGARIDRSRADLGAIGAMVKAGWSDARVVAAFNRPDWFIGVRFRELRGRYGSERADAYLARTLATARRGQWDETSAPEIRAVK